MWNSDDPKNKWLHLVVKLVAVLIIFKLGVLVGEFKMVKAMVLRGDAGGHKMLFWDKDGKGGDNVMFNKRVMPMMGDDGQGMMFWKKDVAAPGTPGQPVPPPQQ